jgi:uncharacterized LabA/DUF88 family protein
MRRSAVFVDAGYLFAQGSTALTGSKKNRANLKLDEKAALTALIKIATKKTGGADLLRVYWYDGALGYRGPTLEQQAVARADNVKLRLGFINNQGQQKGVDSLIVTDLIDLARNQAISDAVLLSGDEDVRIGVQIAQSFGVRVHLLGIEPSRGSQSKQLMHEADTTTEWNKATIAKFLAVRSPSPSTIAKPGATTPPAEAKQIVSGAKLATALDLAVKEFVAELDGNQVQNLKSHWAENAGIPPEHDGPLLARSRDMIGRNLVAQEKRRVREIFKSRIEGQS